MSGAPEEVRYRASGIDFVALAWGDPGAPLALCLHGYPDTAWTWRELGPFLATRGWRVVAPFMRGYAPTGLAPDGCYQIGALAHDAIDTHAALGGDGRAVLIGHDWGAVAAYCAAALAPERFRRAVTLAIPPLGAVLAPPRSVAEAAARAGVSIRQGAASWYMLFQQIPIVSEAVLPRFIPWLWSAWSPGFDGRADAQLALEALSGPGRRTAAMRYYRALLQPWCRSPAYAAEQKRAAASPRMPVLYLHGRDDGCFLVDHTARAPLFLSPDSRVEVVDGAGHFLQLERPETVNELIAGFVEAPGG